MGKIQIESGQSSSATHRMTQTSTTLNRRYVRRPMNAAVEEAAREANQHREPVNVKPSRLVNMRIHAAEFEAARAKAEEEARRAAEAKEAARILAETNSVTLYPNVVEFGTSTADMNAPTPSQTETMTSPVVDPIAPAMTTNVALNPFSTNSTTMPATPTAPAASEPAPVDMDALAMNIAADYAAASLGVSVQEYGNNYSGYAMPEPEQPAASLPASADVSVDAIAQAASEAIASIRVATDPDQVSEQVASLQAFAEKIKTNHDSPEMKELGDTIEKFVNIAKKSTKVQEEAASKAKDKAAVKVSLPAKANRAAAKVTKSSAKVMAASRKKANLAAAHTATTAPARPTMRRANHPAMSRRMPARPASPEELKNRAIEQALHSVATMDEAPKSKSRAERLAPKRKLRARHFMVAFACAAACVAGIIYVVGANIPDISVRVAAMQTGIQATYPSYVPRDYSLKDVSSENGKISMRFDGPEKSSFTLVEEKSSWDSAALLRNYVEPTWGEDYATTHEQGITIYISNTTSDAAWVNGGVLYKITSTGTVLTKKQVRNIVTSL